MAAFCPVLAAVLFAMVACSNEDVHVEDRFVAAFVDIRAMEQLYGAQSPMTRMLRKEILQKYGYDGPGFLQRAEEIQKDEDLWVPFQRQVVDRVDSLLDPVGFVRKKEAAALAKKKKKPEAPK